MTEHAQQNLPTRAELIRALRGRRDQVVTLNQEKQQLQATIEQLQATIEQKPLTIEQMPVEKEHVIAHPVSFPRIQKVLMDRPFNTGIWFGIGMILAPVVLSLILLLILVFCVVVLGMGIAFA